MKMTRRVRAILDWYEGDTPGTKANLARLLMHGRLAGTGRLVVLPVDQGVEHGPARAFAANPDAYDPHWHFRLAVDAGVSAYASVLGMLEQGADTFAGQVPLILKVNSANSLQQAKAVADQAVHGSVDDALRLGCSAIGFTIYPGSDAQFAMMEELRALTAEAKARGLAVVVWSYPRGGGLSKAGETAIDVVTYGAHLAAALGAHIVKVKPPTEHVEQLEARKAYQAIDIATLAARVAHVKQATFAGKRLVLFSGGEAKDETTLLAEIRAIAAGGADGSIMGRNVFQRPRGQALGILDAAMKIYAGKA
ncbi:MAG: class I fructose-bisphosphate aldolase [Alphaproteobacteria bacterium]|nr:class I fructose-bisphosphate aldolase [Alphaproteobacteria bacterium]